jgi:5-methyltetrahydropteroyltriglutamate--homocysteine methyltransferase
MPGVIDSATSFVEHPQLVAQRICRYADVVGRERVIAGVDCGFETFAGDPNLDERIVYHKFASLAEGARIASAQLWPRTGRQAPSRQAGA